MRPAAGVLAAAVLTGCGLLAPGTPDWVTNRNPLPACGEEVREPGQAGDREMRTCLLEAFEAGEGAELISTHRSIEGDPITEYIRVHENGVVELFADATQDRFGSGEWERFLCTGLVAMEDEVFVTAGCESQPVP